MFDCHYDLLTSILIHKRNIQELKKYLYKIYTKDNITGGIFNLFYMSPGEMKIELGIEYKDINIIKNLETVNNIIDNKKLIPKRNQLYFRYRGIGLSK